MTKPEEMAQQLRDNPLQHGECRMIILNVCIDCARKAGSEPKPYPVGVWLGKCCGCGHQTGCSAPRDFTPRIRSFDARENAKLSNGKP